MNRINNVFLNITILLGFVFIQNSASSQPGNSWWNEAHNWDGHTHWTSYIIYSPYYMGPNALAIPESQGGLIKEKVEFQTEIVYHKGKGDNTSNLHMSLYIPVVKDIIAVEFYGVPYERYNMTEELILERRIRYLDGKGVAIGDFYFSTMVQVLKNKKFPDVAFRMACRTASGNRLGDARYTDSPGYYFDASFGKDLIDNNQDERLRLHWMLGFYSWQMDLPNNRQNDAVLYGLGVDYKNKSWFVQCALRGYYGYIGDGLIIVANPEQPIVFKDRPMVIKSEFGKSFGMASISAAYQHALNDFYYNSLSFSFSYKL